MTAIEPENSIGQIGDGSPAQIWTELGLLASSIFGSIGMAQKFAESFEELRTAASSAGVPELPGFKSPAAECVRFLNTHNTTQHTAQ